MITARDIRPVRPLRRFGRLHPAMRRALLARRSLAAVSQWTGFTVWALTRMAEGEEIRISGRMWCALAYLALTLGHDGDFLESQFEAAA